jgi:hypothetical protein
MESAPRYQSLKEFYPFYLSQHQNRTCRILHFVGTLLVIFTAMHALAIGSFALLGAIPFFGYGFAWAGHFIFEKNRPATFQYPLYSLATDFIMFGQILTGQLDFSSASDS